MAVSNDSIDETLHILETGKLPERRQTERVSTKIDFQYLKRKRDGKEDTDPLRLRDRSYIVDISKRGVAINTTAPLRIGNEITIKTTEGATQIKAKVKVINFRRTKIGMLQFGCQFLDCERTSLN